MAQKKKTPRAEIWLGERKDTYLEIECETPEEFDKIKQVLMDNFMVRDFSRPSREPDFTVNDWDYYTIEKLRVYKNRYGPDTVQELEWRTFGKKSKKKPELRHWELKKRKTKTSSTLCDKEVQEKFFKEWTNRLILGEILDD